MKKVIREINLELSGLHVREAEDEQKESREIEGYAVVFGKRSVNLTPWSERREIYEVMEPGSITEELLKRSDIVLTAFHDNSFILGRSTNGKGTLRVGVDTTGVWVRCELAKTSRADEILEGIKRGDLSGMSFAYTADSGDSENGVSYERTEEKGAGNREVWIRHVKRVTGIYDVTVAGHPAYKDTELSVAEREAIEREYTGGAENEAEKVEREAAAKAEEQKREAEEAEKQKRIAEKVAELREWAKWK